MLTAYAPVSMLPSWLSLSSVLILGSHMFQTPPSRAGQGWERSALRGWDLLGWAMMQISSLGLVWAWACDFLLTSVFFRTNMGNIFFTLKWVWTLPASRCCLRRHGPWTCYNHHETKRGRTMVPQRSQLGTPTFLGFWIYQRWNQTASRHLAKWNNKSQCLVSCD